MRSFCVAQAGHLLPQSPECWDYKHVPLAWPTFPVLNRLSEVYCYGDGKGTTGTELLGGKEGRHRSFYFIYCFVPMQARVMVGHQPTLCSQRPQWTCGQDRTEAAARDWELQRI